MTGDMALRLYVYGTVGVLAMWAVLVGWITTRAAWRVVRGQTAAVRAPAVTYRGDRGHGR